MDKTNSIFFKDGTDSFFNDVKNDPHYQNHKEFVKSLYEKASSYLDVDFCHKISDNFHDHFWELYLTSCFLEMNFTLMPRLERGKGNIDSLKKNKQNDAGPDICIISNNQKIWVECIVSKEGEDFYRGKDIPKPNEAVNIPDDQLKLRLLNSFDKKYKTYKKYLQENFVQQDEPCIIAINAGLLPSCSKEREIHRIVRCLLPLGYEYITIDPYTQKTLGYGYEISGTVEKKKNDSQPKETASVRTDSFLNFEYSQISGVIYSCSNILNNPTNVLSSSDIFYDPSHIPNPKDLAKSLIFIHNPFATNPLPLGFIQQGREYSVDINLKYKNWN